MVYSNRGYWIIGYLPFWPRLNYCSLTYIFFCSPTSKNSGHEQVVNMDMERPWYGHYWEIYLVSGNIEEDIMLLGQQHFLGLANNHDQSKDYDMMGSISLCIIGMTEKPTNHGLNCGFIQQSLACVSSAVVGLHYTVISYICPNSSFPFLQNQQCPDRHPMALSEKLRNRFNPVVDHHIFPLKSSPFIHLIWQFIATV